MPITLGGLNSGMDTDSMVKELMSAHRLKLTKIENKKTKNTWTNDKWKELNTKIYALYTGELSTARLQSSYKTNSAVSSSSSAVSVTAGSSASAGAHKIEITQLASSQYVTGTKMDASATTSSTLVGDLGMAEGEELWINGEKVLTVDAETKISDFVSACKSKGITANFDSSQKRFFLSSNASGADQAFSMEMKTSAGVQTDSLETLGLGNISLDADKNASCSNAGATVVSAKDAKFSLDGAEMTSASNTTTVNGLQLNMKEVTTSPVTISVSKDTAAVYDMVKKFIGGYNSMLKEMNSAYYAGSSKGYDPLTDDEKQAMTDDQIKKWEEKIQGSLLRRDSRLNSMLTSFKSAMSTSVEVNGKKYSLASLGICTSKDYTEKGLLHIKGDVEDSTYANEKNQLQEMLENDPDTAATVLQKIADTLYSTMQKEMSATKLSSALTFYNDKQLTNLEKQYTKDIAKMEEKLSDMESRYYKQFAAMETAMAKLNSQQSALAGLLG